MSTIFISHSSADNTLAVELINWLKTQGYQSVFLDLDPEEGIEAGKKWEKVLYSELDSCSVLLALVSESWQESKWCFAEAAHARSSGKTILGLTVGPAMQPTILADTQSIDYSPGNRSDAYRRLAEALRLVIDPQGLGRRDPMRPLFPGLLYFDERDAPIFYGRRRVGRAIYQRLREIQVKPPGSERMLLVFGPSGNGKSSVVRAGTLPHIRANPENWIALGPFRPTEGWPEPLRQSLDMLASSDEVAIANRLREIAGQLRGEKKTPKATILLIIDQLEEALAAEDVNEGAFWLPLSRLLTSSGTPFMALATLRSDFMGDFQKRSARNAVRFGSFPLEPMSTEDLREVIIGPCREAGITIGPGLADALVDDVGDEQALPLLALALNRLWSRFEASEGGFTLTDYRIGLEGMQGLIDREAESTLAGKGLREAAVLDSFLGLTRQAWGGVLTRQPADWEALEPEARKSLDPFINARLLVRYGLEEQKYSEDHKKRTVIVEVVHESLLIGWKRLNKWLVQSENREFLLWREELRHKVHLWNDSEDKKLLFLVGPELKVAKKWLNTRRLALDARDIGYIQSSLEHAGQKRLVRMVAWSGIAAALLLGIGAIWLDSWIKEHKFTWPLLVKARLGQLDWLPEMQKVTTADSFVMGSADENMKEAYPSRNVKITREFAIARHEVTVRQYRDFSILNGKPFYDKSPWNEDDRPVVGISWEDARDYAKWLSSLTGSQYRFPTEAEWEYAARGGMPSSSNFSKRYWWGDDSIQAAMANCLDCGSQWSGISSAPVGSFKHAAEHPLELWDTVGNVSEWVEDCWHENYYNAPLTQQAWREEGNGNGDCDMRVLRGGSYSTKLQDSTSASRTAISANSRGATDVGFRLVQDR